MKKILSIDDSSDNLTVIKAIIADSFPEMEVISAPDGKKGLILAAAENPDIILLDIEMPGMDGFDVCKYLKQDIFLCDIPVVFLTALRDNKALKFKAIDSGAEAFLFKPIDIPEFVTLIRSMIRIRDANLVKRNEQNRLVEMVAERTSELEKSQTAMINLLDDLKDEIDTRIKAEQELKKSNDYLRSILQTTQDGFVSFNMHGEVTDANRAYCDLLGYKLEEIKGLHTGTIISNMSDQDSMQFLSRIRKQGHETFETEHITKKGDRVCVELAMSYLGGENGGFICFCRDLTERKKTLAEMVKLGEELNQAQKMESIGRLAGGVAHDFNNMLGVILGQTEIALASMEVSDPHYHSFREIQSAGLRSSELTKQLLAFARKQNIKPKILDLNNSIEGILKMLRRLIGEDIALNWIPGTNLSTVLMDPSQIDQVLANLCVNARDAVAGIGTIEIRTHAVSVDGDHELTAKGIPVGDYDALAISDTGCGMDKSVMDKLFEPFFTTKEIGKGTGLGLSTVYGIIKQNKGYITVESIPGQGSTFAIYIPVCRGVADETKIADASNTVTKGSGCILLVEDEPILLEMTRTMLESFGYNVLSSATPNEAIRLTAENADKIRLIISDVILPEMSGPEMARQIQHTYPGIKFMFASGYTADEVLGHGVDDDDDCFIQKPFSRNTLAEKVSALMKQIN